MDLNKREKDFVEHLKQIMNTESGKIVLKYLKQDFVDASSVKQTPELTYYALGQKELVQGLIASLEEPEELQYVSTLTIED